MESRLSAALAASASRPALESGAVIAPAPVTTLPVAPSERVSAPSEPTGGNESVAGEAADDAPSQAAEAEAVARVEGAVPPSNSNPDETNVWPDEAAEAAFISEARGRGESPKATVTPIETEEERAPKQLPPLSELVERIPAETRELLDELFRAKFVAVRRVKKSDLKPTT